MLPLDAATVFSANDRRLQTTVRVARHRTFTDTTAQLLEIRSILPERKRIAEELDAPAGEAVFSLVKDPLDTAYERTGTQREVEVHVQG